MAATSNGKNTSIDTTTSAPEIRRDMASAPTPTRRQKRAKQDRSSGESHSLQPKKIRNAQTGILEELMDLPSRTISGLSTEWKKTKPLPRGKPCVGRWENFAFRPTSKPATSINNPDDFILTAQIFWNISVATLDGAQIPVTFHRHIARIYNDSLPPSLLSATTDDEDALAGPIGDITWAVESPETPQGSIYREIKIISPNLTPTWTWNLSWPAGMKRFWTTLGKICKFEEDHLVLVLNLEKRDHAKFNIKARRLFQALAKFEWYWIAQSRLRNSYTPAGTHVCLVRPQSLDKDRCEEPHSPHRDVIDHARRQDLLAFYQRHTFDDRETRNTARPPNQTECEQAEFIDLWKMKPTPVVNDVQLLEVTGSETCVTAQETIDWVNFTVDFLIAAIDCPVQLLIQYPDTYDGLRRFLAHQSPLRGADRNKGEIQSRFNKETDERQAMAPSRHRFCAP